MASLRLRTPNVLLFECHSELVMWIFEFSNFRLNPINHGLYVNVLTMGTCLPSHKIQENCRIIMVRCMSVVLSFKLTQKIIRDVKMTSK